LTGSCVAAPVMPMLDAGRVPVMPGRDAAVP
jgi:hypothetical protein